MIEQAGIPVQSFENVKTFLNAYRADFSGCIIIDVKISGMDDLLQEEVTMV
ncbi:hypothetical protein [Nitrosomonas oligotropha]|uniref:hypothetical protein n=1 Tax=Nitrosomonas oligotropha TaxID=42354 RepID=UPI0015A1B77F|nr:hypothetical protein [Nitrosomonas oligotropha]